MVKKVMSCKSSLSGSTSFLALILSLPAHAQTVEVPEPPVNSLVDARGVDLVSGQLMVNLTPLSIGDASHGLKQSLYYPGLYGFRHDQMITATVDDYDSSGHVYGYHVTVASGQIANGFTWNTTTGAYVPDRGDGATLSAATAKWIYTDHDGNVVELDRTQGPGYTAAYNTISYYGGVDGVATSVTRPDGFKTRMTYKTASYYYSDSGFAGTLYVTRLQSTTSSTGYQLKFNYRSNTLGQSTANDWVSIASEQMINNAVDYCDPTADACTGLSQPWPKMTVGSSTSGSNAVLSFTDPVGRTSSFTFDNSGRIIGYRRPNATADTTSYGYYTGSTAINSVSLSGVGTWAYTFSLDPNTNILSGTVATPGVATALNFTADYQIRQPLTLTDENGHKTTWTYDSNGRVKTRALDGAGSNSATWSYDARGNLTSMVLTPKLGSGVATISTSATYPASPCTNMAICNKPVTTTNSDNQVTNYYYNADGTTNYIQAPAPTTGGIRPEVHYTYATAQARVKSATGSIVNQGDAVRLPTGTISCVTGAYSSCTAANQILTQVSYVGGTGTTNLGVQSSTVKSGSGTPSSTTTFTLNNLGDIASVTDPVGNVTSTTYALDRQPTLTIGPSIDGTATSTRRGVQYNYNADGLPSVVTAGSYFPSTTILTPIVVHTTGYDTQGRKTTDSVSNGTTIYSLTQYSYTSAGRLDCSAVRMNSTKFGGSPPASACTLDTQGSAGPDRITHYVYDNAGQILKTQSAYGLAGQQRNDVTYTYTSHNLKETMTDPLGNLTSFVYDGHDRLLRTCYQGTLSACQSNTAIDYVQLGYDSAGRLISRSRRGSPAALTTYAYDYLGRITGINYPGGGTFDQAVTLAYDNLGRTLSMADAAGHSITYSYDALSDVLSQGDAISSRTMQYDAASRRTRLTWGDNRYVTYDYDGASNLKHINESGTTALVTLAYDEIGRRTSLTRGNGVVTTWSSYSPLGPATIGIDLAGTANDLTLAFTYNAAGQIATRTATSPNAAWAFGGTYTINRSYGVNGLNQYTASGSIVPTYDANGNLTSAGSPGYTYSAKNELTTRTDTGAVFYHDPLGHLDTIDSYAATTRFQYDGSNISTELDGSSNTVLKRYVFGSGEDEPLVQYEGSDFSTKRFLVSDERGSVIAVTDATGNPVAINAYDEYGIPASTNQGRFQYTGQAWIAELGMYSYKARMYSPTMGRFLQTDPAGYPDGPNWYAYAMNDPINGRDPSGLGTITPDNGPSYDDGCGAVYCGIVVNGGGGNFSDGIDDFGSGMDFGDFGTEMAEADFNQLVQQFNISAAQIVGGRQQQSNKACTGPVMSLSIGGSGTFAFMAGGNAGAGVTLNIPTNINWAEPWQGLQLVGSAQAGGLLGAGLFAGVGVQRGVGYSTTHATQGWSTSAGAQAEGDFGWGTGSVGASAQGNFGGVSGATGTKVGAGVGLYAGAGVYGSVQYATPSLGC